MLESQLGLWELILHYNFSKYVDIVLQLQQTISDTSIVSQINSADFC